MDRASTRAALVRVFREGKRPPRARKTSAHAEKKERIRGRGTIKGGTEKGLLRGRNYVTSRFH